MRNEQIPDDHMKNSHIEESVHKPEAPKPESGKIDRRSFLKNLGIGLGVGMATAAFGPKILEEGWNLIGAEELERKIEDIERRLTDKYKIKIEVWRKPEEVVIPPSARKRATSLIEESLYLSYKSILSLERALSPYPPEFIKEHVSGIELVHEFKPYTGTIAEGATPMAVTYFGGSVEFSAGRGELLETHKAMFGEILEPGTIHHEFAHTITAVGLTEEWQKLHPDANYIGQDWAKLKHVPKGFATDYGTKSIYEDMASVAELLFQDEKTIKEKSEGDKVLQRKIERLRQWYEEKSGGKMNEQFWRDYYAGKVNDSYWN